MQHCARRVALALAAGGGAARLASETMGGRPADRDGGRPADRDGGSHGRPETDAQLQRLHDTGHAADMAGLTPAHAGPVPSAERILQAAVEASDSAPTTRRHTEALLEALRSENARLRSKITGNATARATAAPKQSPEVRARVCPNQPFVVPAQRPPQATADQSGPAFAPSGAGNYLGRRLRPTQGGALSGGVWQGVYRAACGGRGATRC